VVDRVGKDSRLVTVTGRERRPVKGARGFEISHDGTLRKHQRKITPTLRRALRRYCPEEEEAQIRALMALDAWPDEPGEWLPLEINTSWEVEEEQWLVVDLGMRYPRLPLLTASGREDDSEYLLDEIVCLTFHGRPRHKDGSLMRPDVADVLHLDYRQTNCAASNLEWHSMMLPPRTSVRCSTAT
jgi:hypothetical protein